MKGDSTTIRISREAHEKLSSCLKQYGLKACPAVSRAIIQIVNYHPELLFPKNHIKSYHSEDRK